MAKKQTETAADSIDEQDKQDHIIYITKMLQTLTPDQVEGLALDIEDKVKDFLLDNALDKVEAPKEQKG